MMRVYCKLPRPQREECKTLVTASFCSGARSGNQGQVISVTCRQSGKTLRKDVGGFKQRTNTGSTQTWLLNRCVVLFGAANHRSVLAGDHRAEPVGPELQLIWPRLRLTALWHLWRASRRGAPAAHAGAQPPTAAWVASHILHDCRGAMQRDFICSSALIECDMGVPLDWLRGYSPILPLRVFKARWGHREVLCRAAESTTMLTLRWIAAHPVPVLTEGKKNFLTEGIRQATRRSWRFRSGGPQA